MRLHSAKEFYLIEKREPHLILASGSATRAALLRGAGIAFGVVRPDVDEDALKAQALANGRAPAQIAMLLAEAKSLAVSAAHPQALVIGADQVLACGGRIFSKPGDTAAAKDQLRALSGKTHGLISAICVSRGGAALWRHTGEARMTMRILPDAEIERYAAAAGGAVLSSVGAYQYEGLGANLFCAVEGDHSTILGLPLLPLLGFLRSEGLSFS
jgi:septum formation protein